MLSLAEITILARSILSALVGSQIKFSFLLLLLLPNLAAAQTEGWESLQITLRAQNLRKIYSKSLRDLKISIMAFCFDFWFS